MALTGFQQRICWLLAEQRKTSGESYVAGGGALNQLLAGQRRSRDVDLFHDTQTALVTSWAKDRATLEAAGLTVEVVPERSSFVDARIRGAREVTLVPPDDVEALLAGILRLLSNVGLRTRLGDACRRHARERLGWEQVARRHVELYRELLAPDRSSRQRSTGT